MLMGSCVGMSIALAIVAATTAEYQRSGSVPSSSASIAFIFIFGVIFAIGFTPMQPIYPAEVLTSKSPLTPSCRLAGTGGVRMTNRYRRHASKRYDGLPDRRWLR